MRFLRVSSPRIDPCSWHVWFAWHPVRAGDYLMWMEPVERRWVLAGADDPGTWEYRALEDGMIP